jgi:GNAT superfamily N-acetyltransferase
MFWKGKASISTQLWAFIKQKELALATSLPQPELLNPGGACKIGVGSIKDVAGIVKLLNSEYDESETTRSKTDVTEEWVRATFLMYHAIWMVAKDPFGTIRGCIASFKSDSPYPNALGGCSMADPWGLVDWFCVHPLWRDKGVGSEMLEALDLITFRMGRKAHIFLKEGYPLPPPNIPIYSTFLHCRRAGSPLVKKMREGTGLGVVPYQCNDRETGLPLVKVDGIRGYKKDPEQIKLWEDALDNDLPPCWVFVTGADHIDEKRGWRMDSMVSMYAFRWIAGKWLGGVPDSRVL